MLLGFLLYAWAQWRDVYGGAQVELRHASRVLDENAQEVLRHYETLLRVIGDHLSQYPPEKRRTEAPRLFADLLRLDPALVGYGLSRPDGQLLVVSGVPQQEPLPNLLEQEASADSFRATLASDHLLPGRTYYLDALDTWMMPLRLAIRDHQGRPLFVLSTGLLLASPEVTWNTLEQPLGLQLYLVRSDGYVQWMIPLPPQAKYEARFSRPLSQWLPEVRRWRRPEGIEDSGFLVWRGPEHTNGLHVLALYPMARVWARWRARMVLAGGFMLVMLAADLGLFGLARQMQRRLEREHRRHEANLLYQAGHDALTGLPNRLLALDRLGQAVALARREGCGAAVLYLDLDHFKQVNDSLGHGVGDALLKAVARRLTAVLRASDTLARLGGDEFLIVLPEIRDRAAAGRIATKLISACAKAFRIGAHRLFVSASVGIAVYPEDQEAPQDLLRAADSALYQAKGEGRGCFRFYTADLDARAHRRLELANALRTALGQKEFEVFYQPQIDLASGRVVGVEALLRWTHPRLGSVPAGEFIPIAEESGTMRDLGRFVLARALEDLAALEARGMPRLRLAVNLSVRQLEDQGFVRQVAHLLGRSGRPPETLEMEITESLMVQSFRHAQEVLDDLHGLGVRLSVDDFGTGYSSLSYLTRLPVDGLKVDRSFVHGVSADPVKAQVCGAIIAMAGKLGLEVVAEGVEHAADQAFLRRNHCPLGQGWWFARPMPAADLGDYVLSAGKAIS